MIEYPLPLLGFCAYSGTGKTTLLTKLLPLLRASGLRIGVLKHAHHGFDIDHPGKDSYDLRHAGAEQMVIASGKRLAWVKERERVDAEPDLAEALAVLHPEELDLVLVEGFKRESFAKIELHRPSTGKPLLFSDDPNIIAIATDQPLTQTLGDIPCLDLNDTKAIARFICDTVLAEVQPRQQIS